MQKADAMEIPSLLHETTKLLNAVSKAPSDQLESHWSRYHCQSKHDETQATMENNVTISTEHT